MPLPGVIGAGHLHDAEVKPPEAAKRGWILPKRRPGRTLPVLRRGHVGEDVLRLQKIINRTGARLKVDGLFGPRTEAAVLRFQERARLKVDGIVGSRTWTALSQTKPQAGIAHHQQTGQVGSASAATLSDGQRHIAFDELEITARPVAHWTLWEKSQSVLDLTLTPEKLGHEALTQIRGLLSTDALVLMVATIGAFGLLLSVASGGLVLALGLTLAFAPALNSFLSCCVVLLTAVTREDLEEASDHLAEAIVSGGIALFTIILGWVAAKRAGGGSRPGPSMNEPLPATGPRTPPEPPPAPRPRAIPEEPAAPAPRPRPKLDQGKQGKHVPGHNNFQPGKSELTHPDPQRLLNERAGTGQQLGNKPVGQPGSKERVDFDTTIGNYVDPATGQATPTTVGIVHYASDGAHIVPARPRP